MKEYIYVFSFFAFQGHSDNFFINLRFSAETCFKNRILCLNHLKHFWKKWYSHSRDFDKVDIHNHGFDINWNWPRKIHSVVLFCFVFFVAVCLFVCFALCLFSIWAVKLYDSLTFYVHFRSRHRHVYSTWSLVFVWLWRHLLDNKTVYIRWTRGRGKSLT